MNFYKKISFLLLFLLAFGQIQAQSLLSKNKWIVLDNHINEGDFRIVPFDSTRLEFLSLILEFKPNGKLNYDYGSDGAEACSGVDFIDIDTNTSQWSIYNGLLVLNVLAGYGSINDFRFKRIYRLERDADEPDVLWVRLEKEEFYKKLRD